MAQASTRTAKPLANWTATNGYLSRLIESDLIFFKQTIAMQLTGATTKLISNREYGDDEIVLDDAFAVRLSLVALYHSPCVGVTRPCIGVIVRALS